MQRYIQQLIEDFNSAERNAKSKTGLSKQGNSFLDMMEKLENDEPVSGKELLGVGYEELPPPEKLTTLQMQDLMISMLNALSANGVNIVFPGNGIPVKLAYRETRKLFKEGFYAFPGWTVDFCNGNCSKCAFADYCTTNKNKNS